MPDRREGALRRYRLWAVGVLGVAVLLACGEAPEPEPVQEPVQEALAAAEPDTVVAEPRLRPFLPDEMQRSTRAESFPHATHEQIDCAVCHQVPQGHGTHGDVECADCHTSSANVTVRALTPEQCQSCHHGVDQTRSCVVCHQDRPTVASVQELDLEVWRTPRTRTLAFDHGLHADLECRTCHQALPALTPAEPCASCHSVHHTGEVRCASCHVEPPAGAHGVEVHLTCSGSGCHRAPEVEAIATQRPVCLACHAEQEDHEPGGDCIECHRVRGEPTASADWRHG